MVSTIFYNMRTRSTDYEKPAIYSIDIDFDYASQCWLKNKTKLQNGCYLYNDIVNPTEKPHKYGTRSRKLCNPENNIKL